MERFEVMDVGQAIEKLSKYKGKKIIICTVDFDRQEEKKINGTTEEGCKLIRNSKSIFYNDDEIVPNMELFSSIQDIQNIIPKGTMHNILFCGKLE